MERMEEEEVVVVVEATRRMDRGGWMDGMEDEGVQMRGSTTTKKRAQVVNQKQSHTGHRGPRAREHHHHHDALAFSGDAGDGISPLDLDLSELSRAKARSERAIRITEKRRDETRRELTD